MAQQQILESLENYSAVEIVNKAVAFTIIIAGGLCLVYTLIGAISFVMSAGDEGKVKNALNTIRYAVLGLILTFLSVFIVGTIGRTVFNLDVIKYISYKEIFSIIQSTVSSGESDNIDSLD